MLIPRSIEKSRSVGGNKSGITLRACRALPSVIAVTSTPNGSSIASAAIVRYVVLTDVTRPG